MESENRNYATRGIQPPARVEIPDGGDRVPRFNWLRELDYEHYNSGMCTGSSLFFDDTPSGNIVVATLITVLLPSKQAQH